MAKNPSKLVQRHVFFLLFDANGQSQWSGLLALPANSPQNNIAILLLIAN